MTSEKFVCKSFDGVRMIRIESAAKVSITEGRGFTINVTGSQAEKVKISQSGDEVDIQYRGSGGSQGKTVIMGGNYSIGNFTTITGNVVVQNVGGKRVEIKNGEVFINGKRVDESGTVSSEPAAPPEIPVEIEIQCPDGLYLDCTLLGQGILGAFPKFKQAWVTIQGIGTAGVQARSGKLNISGSGDIIYQSLGGSLKARISGSGDIKASGELFDDVEASISGSGDVITNGVVQGDYEAHISGTGSVKHSGSIMGRKRKSITGTGTVRW
jgi:hypothetical protein